jgi:hypothetical protein
VHVSAGSFWQLLTSHDMLFLPLQRYDFGANCENRTAFEETCNQQRYGSVQPPEYDLSKVSNLNKRMA